VPGGGRSADIPCGVARCSCLTRAPGSSRATEQRCLLPRSRTLTRPKRRTGSALDAGSVRPGATSEWRERRSIRARLNTRPRVPVSTTGTIASPPPPERCHLSCRAPPEQRRRRRPFPEPYPESAACVRCVCARPSRRAGAASLELAARRGVRSLRAGTTLRARVVTSGSPLVTYAHSTVVAECKPRCFA